MIALREVIPYTTARNSVVRLLKKNGFKLSVQVLQTIRLDTHTPQRTRAVVVAKKDLPRILKLLKEHAQEKHYLEGFHHNLRYCVKEVEKYLQKEQG